MKKKLINNIVRKHIHGISDYHRSIDGKIAKEYEMINEHLENIRSLIRQKIKAL